MVQKRVLRVCCLLTWLVYIFYPKTSHSNNAAAPKIQAAYWGIKAVEQAEPQFRLLKEHGLNTALLKDGYYQTRTDLLQGWGKVASTYNIRLFPVLNFAGPPEIEQLAGKYTPYTDRYGKAFNSTPCPLDETYWHAAIEQRFIQLAHLSTSTGIAGIVFDTEMYGSDFSVYRDFCFCDACWQKFFERQQQPAQNISKEQRFEYLVQHQLYHEYAMFQEERVQSILASIEKQIHDIDPSLSLGILAYQDNWFYRGLIRGLGTAARPVMVFSENSYILGYTPYIHRDNKIITGIQNTDYNHPIARYIPGVWLGRFFPDDLPSQLYNLAIHTDGYWLFTADSLWTPPPPPSGPYALHGSHEDYWGALENANDELQEFIRNSGNYHSTLTPIYQSSFYDQLNDRLVTQSSLEVFMRDITFGNADKNPPPNDVPLPEITYRGKILFHCFNRSEIPLANMSALRDDAQQNPAPLSGTIGITHIPVGQYKDGTSYKLFDNKGMIFLEGNLTKQNRFAEIVVPPEVSGIVSLLIDSGANVAQVSFSGLPFIVEASATFPLATNDTAQTYMFYMKPGQCEVKLRAYCTPGETALLSVQSLNNDVIEKHSIVDRTEIEVTIPDVLLDGTPPVSERQNASGMKGNFMAVSINPIPAKTFDDIQFYFYNEEFPYLLIKN